MWAQRASERGIQDGHGLEQSDLSNVLTGLETKLIVFVGRQ